MASSNHVALVTGANKGLGFAITRGLCQKFSGDVVLTARNQARGQAAVRQLQAEGLNPRFHQLDIDDLQSIRATRDFLLKEYGGLDVLINNAGIGTWPKNKPPRESDFFKDTQPGLSALGLAVLVDGVGAPLACGSPNWFLERSKKGWKLKNKMNIPVVRGA